MHSLFYVLQVFLTEQYMHLTGYCMQYRDGNKNLPNIVENWFVHRNSTICFSWWRRDIFMRFPPSYVSIIWLGISISISLTSIPEKLFTKNLGGSGSPPPSGSSRELAANAILHVDVVILRLWPANQKQSSLFIRISQELTSHYFH